MILFCIAGIIAGTITGLIPGLHTNNIALIVLASPFFGADFMAFLLSMSIVHTFVDFIPSIFLGAPSTDTFEGVLPAHRLLLKGRAFEAVGLTVFGGVIALIGGLLCLPIFILFIENNSTELMHLTPFILIISLIVLLKSEKKKFVAIFVLVAASIQGILFGGYIFPLITGFFGIPTILFSMNKPSAIINQKTGFTFPIKNIKEGFIGLIGGALVSILPGIGNSVAAATLRALRKDIKSKEYLVLLGSINTSNFFFSFAILFFASKTRNGVMMALNEKMIFAPDLFLSGLIIMIFAGSVGALLTIILSKFSIYFFSENKVRLLSIASITIMVGMVAVFNGVMGIVVLFFATSLGMFVVVNKVKRSCCMAALITPTVFFYLFYLL